jgi:alkanesulfonate monooxygenase SsuD/methylene tetrahydromethanopterin reductase-like flavin-dependent oxidoreductase (luciferase family)
MDIGVATVTRGECATREGYVAVAEAAERLGFGFISVNDHIVVPGDIAARYPYSEDGLWAARTAGECLDQLATLAFIAARTERLGLLTSVMVAPHRQPVLAAKMLATIDVLSSGRLIVGCGTGWLKGGVRAVGAPPFSERGRVTDEFIGRLQGSCGPRTRRASAALMSTSTTSCLRPSRRANRIPRSGSAAKAPSH